MNRGGDRREAILRDDGDRQRFLETLGGACGKAGWQDPGEVATARRLRKEATLTLKWITQRLAMGSASKVSHCLQFR